MEAAQVFQRCLRQNVSQCRNYRNNSTISNHFVRSTSTRRKTRTTDHLPSSRAFSTSVRRCKDLTSDEPEAKRSTSKGNAQTANSSPAASTTRNPTATLKKPNLMELLNIGGKFPPSRADRPSPSSSPSPRPTQPLADQLDVFSMVPPKSSQPYPSNLDDFYERLQASSSSSSSRTSSTANSSRRRSSSGGPDNALLAQNLLSDRAEDMKNLLPSLRLKPTLGRTVKVDMMRGIDIGRAFRTLEMRCATNRVRADEREQRTYVRRGQRVKIHRMRRWRALFQAGFVEECARIRKMKAQGW